MALTKAQLVDMNANELILDLDADTSITSDTDDQIDIKIGGADDFRFTANTFTGLAGSTITTPTIVGSTSVQTPLIEFTDGDDAMTIADGGVVTFSQTPVLSGAGLTAGTSPLTTLDIDGATDIGAAVVDADLFIIDDGANGTNRKVTAARVKTYMGAEGGAFSLANLDIDGATDLGAAIVDADEFIIDDGGSGTNRKVDASRLKTYIGGDAGGFPLTALDIDGGTDIGAAIVDADLFIVDDGAGGANRKTAASRITTYVSNLTLTTAAQANVTSLGTLTTLTIDNVIINGSTIGHTSDTDLITVADGIVTVAGEVSMTTLDIGGTNVTSTATELNLLDGVSGLVQADLTKLAALTSTAAELNTTDGVTLGTAIASKVVTTDSNIDTTGQRNLTISGELDAATLDISGAIDVAGNSVLASVDVTAVATAATFEPDGDTAAGDNAAIGFTAAEGLILTGQGTTNDVTIKNDADADVIEIPTGSVNVTMAGTLAVTGVVSGAGFTAGSATLAESELELLDGLTAGTAIASKVVTTDANIDNSGMRNLTISGELDAATLDISGAIDVAGTAVLDGGVEIDNFTINGAEIDLSSGDLLVDVAGDITLDAGGGDFLFNVATTNILKITNSSSDVIIKPVVDAKDIIFQQRDGTSILEINDGAFAKFTAAAIAPEAALTDASTVTINALTQSVSKIVLGGNRTIGLASGGVAGAFISILVIQDGTGSRTVTWNAAYEFTGNEAPTLTTTANLGDLFVFRYNGAKWLETGRNLALVLS